MSILSFIDFLTEGVHDPAKLKAVFVVGGPGSGKSYISDRTTKGLGFKHINSDEHFEKGMSKAGLEATPSNIYSSKGQEIRNKAKKLSSNQEKTYHKGRLGMIIDGTGKDHEKIIRHSNHLRSLGYDTHMVFVNTPLSVAKRRNQQRPRSLPDSEVEKMHHRVQTNLGHFQDHFGGNMHIVDNGENAGDDLIHRTHKKIRKIASAPIQNRVGQQWIKDNK